VLGKPRRCGHSSKEGPGQGHSLNKSRNSPINHLILVCLFTESHAVICFVVNFGHFVKNILEKEYFVVDSLFFFLN
jgi:hypothetical protein